MNIEWFKEQFGENVYKIQTRTRLYIGSYLRHYKDIEKLLSGFSCVAVGMADMTHPIHNKLCNNIIFLFNIERTPKLKIVQDLSKIRNHKCYVDDYAFGDLLYDKLHALVLQIPEQYGIDIVNFRMGRYSVMNPKYLTKDSFAFNVVTKNQKLQEQVLNTFGYTKTDLPEELDEVMKIEEEVFNHKDFDPHKYSIVHSRADRTTWL
jgi:hypothetical protein